MDLHDTRRSILDWLRSRERATVAELAAVTGIRAVTVRHHMSQLRDAALVETSTESVGRGRPRLVFGLTPAGLDALERGAAVERLAGELLRALDRGAGPALADLLRRVADEAASTVAGEVADRPLCERLDAAVRLLQSRGLAVRWEGGPEVFRVIGVGCPYRRLDLAGSGLCELDRHILRQVVGLEVHPEPDGCGSEVGCTFRIEDPAPRGLDRGTLGPGLSGLPAAS